MRKTLGVVGLFLLATAAAQQADKFPSTGTIYGVVIDHDGRPAKRIGLTAYPLGVPLGAVLPHTKTNDMGEYRFEKIPWWGRYTVYAEDEEAGYSDYIAHSSHPPEVRITREHPEAELTLHLPPRAAFLKIKLTNTKTGDVIEPMFVLLTHTDKQKSLVVSKSCSSNDVILIPPDQDLLLHISADGFHEWQESVGEGKPIHLASGSQMTLDVKLVPLKE